jgi:TrmH family RNA methyltransferase
MPSEKIISAQNPRVKSVVRLREHRDRLKTGLTVVEGWREVSRAVKARIELKEVYVCPDFFDERADKKLIRDLERIALLIEVSPAVFAKMAFGDRHEGVLAVCRPGTARLSDLKVPAKPLYVIVETIEKPGNLGAILRTCDAAGVDGVIICDEATDIYNPNVIRASVGTVFAVAAVRASNDEALDFLKRNKVAVCATFPGAGTVYTQENLDRPLAIVIGSEQKGLSGFWMKHSDIKIKIPMRGTGDSLNASVSAAVVIYEVIRQRTQT